MTVISQYSRGQLMRLGFQDSIPLVLAAMPFGVIYGALGHSTDVSLWTILAMSVFVFAGSSQFIAVGLLASATAWPVIVLTTFLVNFRHLLYAATLLPEVSRYSQRIRVPMAFFLTDETFAVCANHLQQQGSHVRFHWYYFGSALFMYINWNICTALGIWIGQAVPDLTSWGLDMAMIVAFIGIVVPCLYNRATLACALVAGVMSVITHDWPHKSGLLISAVTAIVVALVLEQQTPASEVKSNAEQGAVK